MSITGTWTGTGTGWEDLDRLRDRHIATTTTTTGKPPVAYEDPKLLDDWKPGKYYKLANIDIKRIPNNYGIIITKVDEICIPENVWTIGTTFHPTETMQRFTRLTEALIRELSRFHYEKLEGKFEAQPAEAGKTVVPPIEITNAETGERFVYIKRMINRMRTRYMRLRPIFKAMVSSVKTIIPAITTKILEEQFPLTFTALMKLFVVNTAKKFIKIKPNMDYNLQHFQAGINDLDG